MLLDLEHQLLDYPIHILQHVLTRYILKHLFAVFRIQSPLRMHLGNILELMIEVVIIQFERADSFHLLGARLVNAERYDFLLMLDTSILLALAHLSCNFI